MEPPRIRCGADSINSELTAYDPLWPEAANRCSQQDGRELWRWPEWKTELESGLRPLAISARDRSGSRRCERRRAAQASAGTWGRVFRSAHRRQVASPSVRSGGAWRQRARSGAGGGDDLWEHDEGFAGSAVAEADGVEEALRQAGVRGDNVRIRSSSSNGRLIGVFGGTFDPPHPAP
jgi:hypothetical protein